jgi:eukaryotic-like serine/threonine-protein kinase
MAEVWLGFDLLLSRPVAVKLLKSALADDPVVTERFRREAIAVAQLSHPNIVTVYDAIEHDGRQAVVMQLVNGKSLRQLLDEQKRLSPDLTIHIGSCVASALDAAHHAGLVHRDVKPGNILITPDGRVLLTDFGIAKELAPTGDDLTNDNIMMGTAKYLSPEQVRGKRLDGRADLYSLGLVLYECLAGRVPFLGQNDVETALARLQRDPTDIARLRPTLPAGLAQLIHRLLARRPDERYGSGASVRAALADVAATAHDTTLLDQTSAGTEIDRRRPDRTPAGQTMPAATVPMQTGPRPPLDPGVRTANLTPPGASRPGRPAGSPVMRAERDRTPTGNQRVQQRPNRKFEHRRAPSLVVVGGLLLAAAVLAFVLWTTIGSGDPPARGPAPTAAATTVAAATGPATIGSILAYDPEGDGVENDQLAPLAIDGDPSTAWTTVCYSSKNFGGKSGVGLVVALTGPAHGVLSIDVTSAPWQIQVFATADASLPTSVQSWGAPIGSDSAGSARTMTVQVTADQRQFLVLFRQVGPSAQCSKANPFAGSISEIRFEAAT